MCWTTYNKDYTVKKIAEKDIEVFKIIHDDNTPYFQEGITYEVGKICPTVKIDVIERICNEGVADNIASFRIFEGYHSYSKENCYLEEHEWVKYCTRLVRRKSDNAVTICYYGKLDGEYKLADFIIPKGTTYYENEYGEIVSETIKMI